MPSIPIRPSSDTSITTASELVYVAHGGITGHVTFEDDNGTHPRPDMCHDAKRVSTPFFSMNGGSTSGVKTEGDSSQGISLTSPQLK